MPLAGSLLLQDCKVNPHAARCSVPLRMKASCSALTCSRSCRRYLQSGLSPYLQIPACPFDVCAAVQASLPICASAVRGFLSNLLISLIMSVIKKHLYYFFRLGFTGYLCDVLYLHNGFPIFHAIFVDFPDNT